MQNAAKTYSYTTKNSSWMFFKPSQIFTLCSRLKISQLMGRSTTFLTTVQGKFGMVHVVNGWLEILLIGGLHSAKKNDKLISYYNLFAEVNVRVGPQPLKITNVHQKLA